jgi:hypothetical protein
MLKHNLLNWSSFLRLADDLFRQLRHGLWASHRDREFRREAGELGDVLIG